MMNPVKSLALCAILLYPPLSTGQLSGVVPGTTTNIPDSTTATSGSDTGSTAEHVTDTPDEIAAPSTDISVTPPRTVGTAAPTAPAEPAAVPPADAEAPAAAFAAPAEDTGTPAETPDTVSEPAGATPESAAESDVAPADPSVEAPTDSPESNETAAAAPVAPRDFNRVKSHMVIVRDEIDEDARQAPGFGLSDQGHILTDSSALRSQDTYLVSVAGGPVFTASALKTDEETGLMLLRIVEQGHGLTALTFARTSLAAAAQLHAVKFTPGETEPFTFVAGTVTQLPTDADESPLIVHNALFNVAAAGTPLLNRCWEVVGINVLQRKGFQQKRIDPMEQSSARSLPASWLSAFLASANLSLPMAESECLSLEEETRLRMEKFQQEKEAALQAQQAEAEARARAVTEEAQRKEEELNRETAAVQQQLEQTRQDNEQALQAEREAAEAERARLEVEAQQRLEQAQQAKEQAVQAQQQESRTCQAGSQAGDRPGETGFVVFTGGHPGPGACLPAGHARTAQTPAGCGAGKTAGCTVPGQGASRFI